MFTSLICAIMGVLILAGLSRVARLTGAAERTQDEEIAYAHEWFYPRWNESRFFIERKWEVKAD